MEFGYHLIPRMPVRLYVQVLKAQTSNGVAWSLMRRDAASLGYPLRNPAGTVVPTAS